MSLISLIAWGTDVREVIWPSGNRSSARQTEETFVNAHERPETFRGLDECDDFRQWRLFGSRRSKVRTPVCMVRARIPLLCGGRRQQRVLRDHIPKCRQV